MAITHTIGVLYKSDAGTIANTTEQYTGNGEANFDDTVAASTTNEEIDIAIDVSAIQSMCIYASCAMTLKTNSSSSPADTIALAAGKQVVWNTAHHETCPLTVDVTKIYVTNAGGSSGALKIRVLLDSTP